MIAFPNAKINLGLYITERRPDRFHNLESVFMPVGWTDVLEILPEEETSFRSSGILIPGDTSTNLCLKAYESLRKDFSLPPVWIHLHKVIPIGAGLGGGSSDAAFTLKMLNELFDLKLNADQLESYARPLGSDCAFFIRNESKLCLGKGDEFSEIVLNLAGKSIILIYPDIHSSTAEAYAGIQPQPAPTNWKEVLRQAPAAWKDLIRNDFETSLFPLYPQLRTIKQQLYEAGASYASMSGSGSTVFGIFDGEIPEELGAGFTVWKGKL